MKILNIDKVSFRELLNETLREGAPYSICLIEYC